MEEKVKRFARRHGDTEDTRNICTASSGVIWLIWQRGSPNKCTS